MHRMVNQVRALASARSRILLRPVLAIAAAATATLSPAAQVPAGPPPYDLIIRNGKIVDGTGNPWFHGDLAIIGDRILAVGFVPAAAAGRVIDAAGLVVAPGFIDMHSHSDRTLFQDGQAQSKIRQGVTTEILGETYSGGPYRGKLPARRIPLKSEVRVIASLADFFTALEASKISVNVASYVGIGNVWQSVMGHSFDRPTGAQLKQMQNLIAEAMREGALGLSTQVMTPPGSLANTADLIGLAKVARRFGGIYSTHIRNEGLGVFDAIKEAISVGETADIPVDVIHLKIADQVYWGRMNEVIGLFESARTRGVNIQANVYPYTRGNNNLVSIIPPWAHEGGRSRLLERLREPTLRKKLKEDIEHGIPGWYNHYTAVGRDWSRMLISANGPLRGMTMDRILAKRNEGVSPPLDPLDILFDLLLEFNGSIGTVYAHHQEADMNLALSQPWCSIGSDGAAYAIKGPLRQGNPHPRNFGTFPRVLGRYVRERGLLTLEDAVRKMTSLNAAKVDLRKRGLLQPGFFADITLFHPHKVIDLADYTDPFHYNEGIEYVIVNGAVVLERGTHTGALPGRVLRRAKQSSNQ
ncbi:MAG: N-acyl-D-amino-acid deacylase [Limisphaerales bacterium]|jgi:N-acyl-D-amino-acid deacylase